MSRRGLHVGRPTSTVVVLVAATLAAASLVDGAAPRAAGTLQLNGQFRIESVRDTPCPPGTRAGILCPGRTGGGVVPGLGRVTESYSYIVDETPPDCPAGSPRVLGYPIRWVVEGKGEIHFAAAPHPDCLGAQAFTAGQSFTVAGGTGIYAGASGAGTVGRALGQTDTGARGLETWTGTLTVPGLEFDVTAPVINGARAKTVRVPRKATRARVTYTVTATDAVDGPVPARCAPASGRRFKVGRTVVRCVAADSSGNSAAAAFPVTVRRR